ncbi:DNA polymerase III subunit gamma and tau [Arthrobacter pityocampae]|uniref:DNA polymerase III subunit gamma/tau n=1 Tax=Arthrobacter pityocampae TaxID=547334 RepID=A0A2S5IUJ2_9MICC|nr:DNA polymerase III subunit gamma and tau [Arthrobacter pityocampae]PPB48206.1 DNA polymerase III subunit gamma and tau [Arthrobacter pityocampae]
MSTALYRRYRPETFADVIGQEHVTEPLMAAIDKDRINHAYLFSGPRGCGKTTSARILARCLNCAQGPTSTPCGVCDSCVELARGGSGSLDVIEIDAASHGGVDDARDLRERATFAPVRDRFKIFIIDEAHMVTSAGFNALLKIVEEPPEHILFIFATTEPDKVIGTIRSRTHHYPFRLVPPEPLMAYLELLCRKENVPVAPGVLSLVVRAGGGSVRDSLSVLDQLMAGASETGLDYELAVSLLGYTHATLLDDVVDSVAAGDAATVFNAVDRVIQTGHDPRRFVEDLLERFRDLIVINAVPEGAASILRGVPDDQLNRMRTQATQLGAGELSRAADVTNAALNEMTGATSPRLHLELLCARLLLPAADASVRGTLARVDRIERRLEYAAGTPAADGVEPDAAPVAAAEPSKPPRPRLDGVPRTAEEAAARWSLPVADPAGPAVPAAAAAQSPAVPAAARQPGTPAADSSPDWGGNWGVSTPSAFAAPEPEAQAAAPRPAAGAPGTTPGAPAVTPGGVGAPGESGTSGAPATAAPGARDTADAAGAPDAAGSPSAPDAARTPVTGTTDRDRDAAGSASTAPMLGAPRPDASTPDTSASDGVRDERPAAGERGPDGPVAMPETGRSDQAAVVDDGARRRSGRAPQSQGHEGSQGQRTDGAPGQHLTGEPGRQPDAGQEQHPAQASGGPAQPQQEARRPEAGRQQQPAASGGNVEMIRRAWPEIMDEVAQIKRATWLIVNVSAKPRSFEGNQLVLAFVNQGNAIGFQRGPHMDNLKQAIHKVLGLTCSIEAVHDAGGAGESGPKVPARTAGPGSSPGPASSAPGRASDPSAPREDGRPAAGASAPAPSSPASPGAHGTGAAAPAPSSLTGSGMRDAGAAETSTPSADDPPPGPASVAGRAGHANQQTASAARPAAGDAPTSDRTDTEEVTAAPTAESPQPVTSDTPGHNGADTAGTPDTVRPAPAAVPPTLQAGQPSGIRPAATEEHERAGTTAPPAAPAARDTRGDAPVPNRAEAPAPNAGASRDTRPAGRPASGVASGAASAPGQPGTESVSAWDPSMSDDSWALVEPPEEAFDPGPGWGSVPEDPFARRATGPRGTAEAAPAPDTTDGRGPDPRSPKRAPAPQGPSVSGSRAAPEGAATSPAPAPAASRSVIWSPPDTAPPTTAAGDRTHTPAPGTDGTDAGTAPQPPFAHTTSPAQPRTAVVPRFAAPAPGAGDAPTRSAPGATPPTTAPGGGASQDRPATGDVLRKPVSRYQQLLDEAERKRAEEAAAARGVADLRFVEDEPSADDETIEESGLVGRTAIERILNGRLVEERSIDGQ